jgi:23S rRNA pseudouridine2605 synthase
MFMARLLLWPGIRFLAKDNIALCKRSLVASKIARDHPPIASGRTEAYESISKIIAETGICSRRSAETLIKENRVNVNGNVCCSSALKYDMNSELRVTIDGVPLKSKYFHQIVRIWALNKTCNELVDVEDRTKRRSLAIDRLKATLPSADWKSIGALKPIYRLDFLTEGLCLFTNSGLLAKLLNSSDANIARHFRVRVHGLVSESKLQGLRRGLYIDGIKYKPMDVSVQRTSGTISWLAVTLYENRSRIIQTSFQKLYLNPTRIICVGYGPYRLSECVGSKSAVAEISLTPELNAMYMKSLSGMRSTESN